MTLTIELTPEQEATLQAQATATGLDASEYAHRLLVSEMAIDMALPSKPRTGAEILAYWDKEDARGLFDPNADSVEMAEQLRHKAQTRDWSETQPEIKQQFAEALQFHIEGLRLASDKISEIGCFVDSSTLVSQRFPLNFR